MAKQKIIPTCSNCFYGTERKKDILTSIPKSMCRRYPQHMRFDAGHWCGEYLDETTGGDLILKPEDKT